MNKVDALKDLLASMTGKSKDEFEGNTVAGMIGHFKGVVGGTTNIFTILIKENDAGDGYVVDKTYPEIEEARLKGMIPEIRTIETDWEDIYGLGDTPIPYAGSVFSLTYWDPNDRHFVFTNIAIGGNGVVYISNINVSREWGSETDSVDVHCNSISGTDHTFEL